MSHAYVPRVNEGGNFCGHNPGKPALDLAKPAANRQPLIIRRLQERIPDFYWSPEKLPSLNAANRSARVLRSERREGCLRILSAILKFTDVASLRVGVPSAQGFMGVTISLLAKHAGMTLRRAERAVANLKTAGLLTVSPVAEKQDDGSYLGVAAVKAVSKHLWGCFGLLDMLKHEREKASKRARKVQRKTANVVSRAKSRAALTLDAIRTTLPRARRADPELQRRLALREIELRIQDPGRPIADIQRQARQELS